MRQLTSFRHHLNLWLTLANVNAAPKGTRGHLRKELVHLFRLRVRRLVSNAAGAPFIHAANRLVQQAWPEDFHMPSPLPENSDVDQLETESEHPMLSANALPCASYKSSPFSSERAFPGRMFQQCIVKL